MANVILDRLRDHIIVNGIPIPVSTNFRDWMDFVIIISSRGLKDEGFIAALSLVLPRGIPSEARVDGDGLGKAILAFMKNSDPPTEKKEGPQLMRDAVKQKEREEAAASKPRVIDYEEDAGLILAAFMQVYGIDLSTADLHWHIFKALLDGLPDDCKLKKVMGYRALDASDFAKMGKEEAKSYRELQRIYSLPDNRTQEEIDAAFAASL